MNITGINNINILNIIVTLSIKDYGSSLSILNNGKPYIVLTKLLYESSLITPHQIYVQFSSLDTNSLKNSLNDKSLKCLSYKKYPFTSYNPSETYYTTSSVRISVINYVIFVESTSNSYFIIYNISYFGKSSIYPLFSVHGINSSTRN